jgi:hypothetical protein
MPEPTVQEKKLARDIVEVIKRSLSTDCIGVNNMPLMDRWYADIGPGPERKYKIIYSENKLECKFFY